MPIPLIYSPHYSYQFPENHRFPMSKFSYLKAYLDQQGLTQHDNVFRPGQIKPEVLAATHADDYIFRFKNNQLSHKESRKMGLPWSAGLVRRSLISPNGTLMTGSIALKHGVACHLAGGTHHAFYDHGKGYCVFNDLAIAARALVAQGAAQRILIFDCDVHQGDGTASILQDDESIYTCSIHCDKNFPHMKQRSNLDVALAKGTSDDAYLAVVKSTLEQAIGEANPDLVFYDAGVDVFQGDDLGFLDISYAGIKAREYAVLSYLKNLGIPVATVIGGGYDRDKQALAERHALVIEQAHRVYLG